MRDVWKNTTGVWEPPSSEYYATSRNCHYSLINNPEEGGSWVLPSGILKSRKTDVFQHIMCKAYHCYLCLDLQHKNISIFSNCIQILCIYFNKIVKNIYKEWGYQSWSGKLSRYSDWLQAGRSGDRIPVGVRFFALVQPGRGDHPASCTRGIGSFPGVEAAGEWGWSPNPI